MVESSMKISSLVGIEVLVKGFEAVVVEQGKIAHTYTISLDEGQETIQELINLIEKLKADVPGLSKIGLAVPGLVDRKTGRIAYSANIPAHSMLDLVSVVNAASGVDAVLENDANAAAYGEYSMGAGRGAENIFYATLGDGVGGAFIFGGEIWRGASGFAGEFGYMTVDSEGLRLEDLVSSANIVERTKSRFHQDSTSSLSTLSEDSMTIESILDAVDNSDDFAQMMLERTGTYVGTAIAGVINLLNVERIIIGGNIIQAKTLVLNSIKESAKELAFEPSFASTTIVAGELGRNAAAVGAALISEYSEISEIG